MLTKLRSMPESELDRLTQPPLQMAGGMSPAPGSISRAASEHVLRRQSSAVALPLHVSHRSWIGVIQYQEEYKLSNLGS